MFLKSFYKTIDKDCILQELRAEGYVPLLINNKAYFKYEPHVHPEQKLIVIISGNLQLTVEEEIFQCEMGDKIVIPPYLEHSAIVGEKGCSFFWSEKNNILYVST